MKQMACRLLLNIQQPTKLPSHNSPAGTALKADDMLLVNNTA